MNKTLLLCICRIFTFERLIFYYQRVAIYPTLSLILFTKIKKYSTDDEILIKYVKYLANTYKIMSGRN